MSGRPIVLAAVLLVAAWHAAGDDREAIGYIEEIQGTVWLKSSDTTAVRLSPQRDLARKVYDGELVRCEKDSSIRLRLGYESQKLYAMKVDTWFRLSPRWPKPTAPEVQEALVEYGRVGGRPKGGSGPSSFSVYSPSEGSAIVAETFSIRWNHGSVDCPLVFRIHDMNRQQVWSQNGVASATGGLEASQLRRALLNHRAQERSTRLELTVEGRCMTERLITFKLLSIAESAALKEQLSNWDYQTDAPILLHLGRAHVFARHGLYAEVASEYEDALILAPYSRELLLRTSAAQERIGNLPRAIVLADRLGEE
jgi:hypothetical protein